jgi:signal transduction histidine kinase/DNA-binding response OmpR family regulator
MRTPLRVLIVEDSEDDAFLVMRELKKGGYEPMFERVDAPEAFTAALARQSCDVVIADYSMPHFSGLKALTLLKESGHDLPFIIVSGAIGEEVAVSAMKAGAHDYVMKDNLARLGPAVQRELQEAEARQARRRAEEALRESRRHLERSNQTLINKVAQLEALHNISAAMSSTLETEALLQSIVERATTLVGAASCSVLLPDEETRELVFYAAADGTIGMRVPEGQGIAARVLRQATPQIVADVTADPDYYAGIAHETDLPTYSLLAVPLLVGYRVIGVLEAINKSNGSFCEQDRDLLVTLASHAATAIQNARLYAEAQQELAARVRAERLMQALNEAALAMERALTPEKIFAALADELKKLGLSSALFLTDESQSRLFPEFFSYGTKVVEAAEEVLGLKAEDFAIPIDTVDAFTRGIRQKQTVFVEDVEAAVRQLLPGPLQKSAEQIVKILNTPKSINAPLIVEDEVIGLLSVQSGDLIEDDMPAITAFAYQMAAVWRKTRLLQDLERSLKELKRTQAQFVQAQKMEAIGTLAGGVAHDFNNLLTVINGFAELMRFQLSLNDPCQQSLEKILCASKSAVALVRQLLAFSRREAARPVVLDLNGVTTEALKLLGRVIGEDVELITHLAPDLAPVHADPGQMEQVLMNLAVNARDAMPGGGKLTIETANLALDESSAYAQVEMEPGEYVLLTVSDTGVGIDDEVLAHIFEPFFTTKPKGKGTGLGLATVYGIVGQHGGHIHVYSEPGQGTTFRIYFPVYQPSPDAGPEETAEPQVLGVALPTGVETLLVAEDETSVRELIQVTLEGCGYTVLSASDAQQAIELFRAQRDGIGLLISDVVMPDVAGPVLYQTLVEEAPALKVLFLSGYTGDIVRGRGVLQDVPFLPKPFSPIDLARKVRQVLDNRRDASNDLPLHTADPATMNGQSSTKTVN